MVDSCLNQDASRHPPAARGWVRGSLCERVTVREVHVLTVSSNLPMGLLDDLLTSAETLLHKHGASRVWIDAAQPGNAVLAEFPTPAEQPWPMQQILRTP